MDEDKGEVKYTNKSRTKQQIHLFFVELEYVGSNGIRTGIKTFIRFVGTYTCICPRLVM
mgnify:CR=1 FL=1